MPVTVTASHDIDSESVECQSPVNESVITTESLSVLTLNLAHGRKDALNQMLQKTSTTRRNLEEIADFLTTSGADLIALQEADSPSRWSGKFNHVDFVKLAHTFAPSPPTTNKGFVMGKVRWNPGGRLPQPITVSVISVHLDFSRKKVRESQTAEMRAMLPDISTPVIILGDFNTDWDNEDSSLKSIVENGNLKIYQPEATDLGTYKNGKHRLDWILISKDLEFVSYNVPLLVLSDHQPVQASVRLLENPEQSSDEESND